MTSSDTVLDMIEELRGRGESFCLATILRTADSTSARAGAKALVTPDGTMHGFIGGACVSGAVRKAAQNCLETGEPEMIRVKPADEVVSSFDVDGIQLHKSSCPSGGTVDIFLEPMRAARTLLVCGASPIARAIVRFGKDLGFRVVVAARKEDHDAIKGAAALIDGFDFDELTLTEADAAIISTQGIRDREALTAVLKSGAGYRGMVCSRRKLAKLSADILATDPSLGGELAKLNAPAGLPINAIEPEEIALSVMAEVVQHRRAIPAESQDAPAIKMVEGTQ